MLILSFIIGVIIGLFIAAYCMTKFMLVRIKIEGKNFEEVNEAIMKTIPSFEGWGFPIESWKFYESQIKKGFTYDNIKNMIIHFVCKPSHANKILRKYPFFGGIMPCSWAVYETVDGDVYIAKMNIKLMSYLYTGLIKEIMKDVAKTEEEMIRKIREYKRKD